MDPVGLASGLSGKGKSNAEEFDVLRSDAAANPYPQTLDLLVLDQEKDYEQNEHDLRFDTENEERTEKPIEVGPISPLERDHNSATPTSEDDFPREHSSGLIGGVKSLMNRQSSEPMNDFSAVTSNQLGLSTVQGTSDSDGSKPYNPPEIAKAGTATNERRLKPSTGNMSVEHPLKIIQYDPHHPGWAENIADSGWEQHRVSIIHWHGQGLRKRQILEHLAVLGYKPTVHQLVRRMRAWDLLDSQRLKAIPTRIEGNQDNDASDMDLSDIDYGGSEVFSTTVEPARSLLDTMSVDTLETDTRHDWKKDMMLSTLDSSAELLGQEQQQSPGKPSPEVQPSQRKTSVTLPEEFDFEDNISVISVSSRNSDPGHFVTNIVVKTQRGSSEAFMTRYDTGADCNIISESTIKRLALSHGLERASGIKQSAFGVETAHGRDRTRQGPYRARFHVVEAEHQNLSFDALLGAGFIRKHGLHLNHSDRVGHFGDATKHSTQSPLQEAKTNLESTTASSNFDASSGKDNPEAVKQDEGREHGFESEGSPKKSAVAVSFIFDSLPDMTEGTTVGPLSVAEEPTGDVRAIGYPLPDLSFEDGQSRVFLHDRSDLLHKSFDFRSVVSTDDDVASQASLERPAHDMWAEDYLASFLIEDQDIGALCKVGLSSIERDRLIRNLRRLLKSFYISLVKRAKSTVEKHAIALLRRRISRERIAARMVNSLEASTEEERLRLEGEIQAAKVRVNAWLRGVHSGAMADESHAVSSHDTNLSDSGSDSESDPEDRIAGPLNVVLLEDFLREGDPVCQFRARLQAFLLPHSLASMARILLTVPTERIFFLDGYEQSLSDRFKCHLEDVSGARWNWWPLSQSQSYIKPSQVRIRFQCHCGSWLWYDIAGPDAEQLRCLVRLKGNSTYGEHLCLKRRELELALVSSGHAIPGTRPTRHVPSAGNTSNSAAPQPRPSSPTYQQRTTRGRSKRSSSQRGHLPVTSKPSPASHQASGTAISIPLSPRLYILLGAQRERRNLEIGHLDTMEACNDGALFLNLKAEYRRLRGFFRSSFSIWQLSHCEFVKFHRRFHNLGVFSKGYDLPTDTEYTYDPRKPNAEDPPITAHEFREALSTCSESCLLRHCTFAHKCQPQSREQAALKLIPKKCSIWDYKAMKPDNEMAWGLEACHEISALLVVIYHIILMSVPYGFWAYWQGVHPKDMQNASIPTTVVVSMITLFWTLSGIIQVLREPLASRT